MNWTTYFIKKPVFSVSICLFILFLGSISLIQLPLRLFPKIDLPIINIDTEYLGASSETIQKTVTNIMQNALVDLQQIDYIQSSSSFGKSNIQIHFKLGNDTQLMLNEVINKIYSVKQLLPTDSNDSVITKLSADDKPIYIIAFSSNALTYLQISDYLKRVIKPKLELIPDIASVDVMGESPAMRIWLDLHKLEENQLTPLDIAMSLRNQNITAAIGIKKMGNIQYTLDMNSALTSVQQFNQVVVKSLGNNTLQLKDIGSAKLGSAPGDITTAFNGIPASMIFVKLLPEANPLITANYLHSSLAEIKKILPANMQVNLIYDASRYIHLALHELVKTVFITLMIIVIVVLLFLGNMRITLMPIISIPLSLIGVGSILWMTACTINTLTLLAMVIAIGLVVDDSIIVIENIYRFMESGKSIYQAAMDGIKEIASPVISMSVILTVVYIPIMFLNGLTGKLFGEFAITLAASVLISAVVAIVLIPMMCIRIMPARINQYFLTIQINQFIQWLIFLYHNILDYVLTKRTIIYFSYFFILVSSALLYHFIPKEIVPYEDQGLLQVIGNAPMSSTASYLKTHTQQINKLFQNNREIERYVYVNNVPEEHQFLSFITLKPIEQRRYSISALHGAIQQDLDQLTGIQSIVIEPPALPMSSGMPVEFVLKSDLDYEKLFQMSELLKLHAIQSGKFRFIDQDVHFDKPQYDLHIDRNLAAELNVKVSDIADNLALLHGENKIQQFNMNGENYPVILHVDNEDDSINQLHLKNQEGNLVPIDTFIHTNKSIKPDALNQFQKMNAITLQAVMRPGNSVADGLSYLNKSLQDINNNERIIVDYSGESRTFLTEMQHGWLIFLFATVLIYLILAILFESFIYPAIVLIACLPGTFFSVLCTLYITKTTLNLYTEIGLLTLIGLVCKHGILIIQFAEKLRQQKMISIQSAAQQAVRLRLRPILMTTAAMLFSAIPLIFSHGAGSVSHFDLGIVIASGISFGTLFALICVPFFYCIYSKE